jgi:hypothetical protein
MKTNIINDGKFKFIFLNMNARMTKPMPDPYTWLIQIQEYQAKDLERYCYKRYLEQDIPIDFDKVVKTALAWYLKKEVSPQDEKEIERMKKAELKALEDAEKAGKLNQLSGFEWNIINDGKEKKDDGHKKG